MSEQVAFERRAIRRIGRPDMRAALDRIAETWREGSPDFLPETEAQLRPSIEEVALQVVNGDPRRPRVVEISAGPRRWGGDVPGGRRGIDNPDTLDFAVPIEPGVRCVVTRLRHADGPIDLKCLGPGAGRVGHPREPRLARPRDRAGRHLPHHARRRARRRPPQPPAAARGRLRPSQPPDPRRLVAGDPRPPRSARLDGPPPAPPLDGGSVDAWVIWDPFLAATMHEHRDEPSTA